MHHLQKYLLNVLMIILNIHYIFSNNSSLINDNQIKSRFSSKIENVKGYQRNLTITCLIDIF